MKKKVPLVAFFFFSMAITQTAHCQYSSMELAIRYSKHDFLNSPLNELVTQKRGKIKYRFRINEEGNLVNLELIRNDFNDEVEKLCRKEIQSLVFVPPPVYGEKFYDRKAVFKFKRRFKSFKLL